MLRSFCLEPRRIPHASAERLRRLQPLFHKLYDGLARDVEFICAALAPPKHHECAWLAHELSQYRKLAPHASNKPRLLLPNSVYLQPSSSSSNEPFVLSVGNVQAGEPYQLQLVHTLQREEHGAQVEAGPLNAVCTALAEAARLVHPTGDTCVAILAKPLELLAMRTRIDVRGVGERLRTRHGVSTVLYLSIDDLADAHVDPTTRELCLGPHRISTVYIRYDFSHPFGRHLDADDPLLNKGEFAEYLRREWRAVDAMERSSAVLSSSLGSRLGHRRRVQHALRTQPGALERFLAPEEAAAVRAVLPEQWALGGGSSPTAEAQEARERFEAAPDAFVAKSALRPRTGSGATQDRHASGGMPRTTASGIRELLSTEAASWFLLYPKVCPQTHDAAIVHGGDVHHLDDAAASEIAAFGCHLTAPPADGGEAIIDRVAGFGARTRPVDSSHPLAGGLGYGALNCVIAQT